MKQILRLLVLAVFTLLASFLLGVGIVASVFFFPLQAGYQWGVRKVVMRATTATQGELGKLQGHLAAIRARRMGPPDDVQ